MGSRVAKNPVELASGVEVKINGQEVTLKGPKGSLAHQLHPKVHCVHEGNTVGVKAAKEGENVDALLGTSRALINNMNIGVSQGFEKKLKLVGVGYRALVKGNTLDLTLGFSHPVHHPLPDGVSAETPSATEVVIKGIDKQKVGQVAADIRAYRPPEPYKGKGVRYADEYVKIKEAKKK